MRIASYVLMTALSMSFMGCANLQSIGRSTLTPSFNTKYGSGLAIHLDPQQRLVVFNRLQKFCAEPSPDALAAYTSAIGLSASHPSQVAASLSGALQSSAGSIGLRTQSITLMRDALFRMCEAFMNNAIGPVQVATLLGRSQDLTAVILAVEQLTGAVAANQAILTGTAGAGSSASLLSNQHLLEAARNNEEEKKNSLAEIKEKQKKIEATAGIKNQEIVAAEKALQQATVPGSTVSNEERTRLEMDLNTKRRDLGVINDDLAATKAQVATKELMLSESSKTRETIENIRDSALTNTVANTSSAGEFSLPTQRKELSKDATDSIASAVALMVGEVLKKKYSQDSCMVLLTTYPEEYQGWDVHMRGGYDNVRTLCMELLSANVKEEIKETIVEYGPDAASTQIMTAIGKDPRLQSSLNEWLVKNGLDRSEYAFLISGGGKYILLRKKFIDDELKGQQVTNDMKEIKETVVSYGADSASTQIMTALEKDPKLQSRLNDWMVKNGLDKEELPFLVTGGGKYIQLRKKIIDEVLKSQ